MSSAARTLSHLLELESPIAALQSARALPCIATLAEVLENTDPKQRDHSRPWLLVPCDLQALKTSGVTFVASMLERVLEEQARGDASRAEAVRSAVVGGFRDDLANIKPGSAKPMRLKEVLIAQGVWSQYLEVGIGPDAEIFFQVAADVGGWMRCRSGHRFIVCVERPGARNRAGR